MSPPAEGKHELEKTTEKGASARAGKSTSLSSYNNVISSTKSSCRKLTLVDTKPAPYVAVLSATYALRWKANTAYAAGDAVLNPAGDVVTAKAAFTSGSSYDATNWNLSNSFVKAPTVNPTYLGMTPGYDPGANGANRWFTAEEQIARSMSWCILTDPKYGGVDLTGLVDATAVVQAAINDCANAQKTLWIPPIRAGFINIAGTLNLVLGKFNGILGAGRGATGGTTGTLLKKTTNGTLLAGVGTGVTTPTRVWFDIRDMSLLGGGGTGVLVKLQRVSDSNLDGIRFAGQADTLLQMTEWWNCNVDKCFFQNGGSGDTNPVVLMDGATDPTNGASGNTISFTACEWEANTGTDVKITGCPGGGVGAGQDWTVGVQFTNCKLERNSGSYPLVYLERAGGVVFTGGFMHFGTGATSPHIIQSGVACVPSRPNGFVNVHISGNKWTGSGAGSDAVVPYFVDHTVGSMVFSNVTMNGNPTSAFFHVGAGVGLNDLRLSNVPVTDRSKLFFDERPGSTQNLGTVEVPARYVQQGATVITPSLGADQVVYKMLQSVKTDGNVTIPSDAAAGRPIRVRVLWYSPGTAGNVRLEARAKPGMQGGSNTIATPAEVQPVVITVPATANQVVQTSFTFAATANPGHLVPVTLSRNGADATDTLTGSDIRILQVELRYERAF